MTTATIPFHRTTNNAFTTLAAGLADDGLSAVVYASVLDTLATPFYADLGQEIVEVTDVTTGTPVPGQSTWTIVRAVFGGAATYLAGVPVAQRNYAEQLNELQDGVNDGWNAFRLTLIAGDGIIATDTLTQGKVTPGTGLTVAVGAGVAVMDDVPVEILAQTVTITPPGTGTENQQIRINAAGVASAIVAGVGAGAASGYFVLADLAVAFDDTSFATADITDRRVFI